MKNQRELDDDGDAAADYEEQMKRVQKDRKRAVRDDFDLRLDLWSNENSNPLMRKRDENTQRERKRSQIRD